MSTQTTLFETTGYGQTKPSAAVQPAMQPAGAATRDAAYQAVRNTLGPKQARLLDLYLRAQREGIRTKAGVTLRTLSDMEAARLLSWERTAVNARRNELVAMGYVEAAETRACYVTSRPVTAWQAVPQLEL